MLNDCRGFDHIYLKVGFTDLRRGLDGLVSIVREDYHLDPYSNSIFLFCGRRNDRIKALVWEGDGFLVAYKRLETGSFRWPRSADEVHDISDQQFRWLMEGLNPEQKKAIPKIYPRDPATF